MTEGKSSMDLFRGRRLIIATQHGKEQVIAPELEKSIGVQCEVTTSLDTDQFGMFSGEIQREGTALASARKKAQAALTTSGVDLAIASEGSFGPHPYYSFIPGNEELLLLIDQANDLELVARYLTTETNYAHLDITKVEEINEFCEQVGFPEHGIILKASLAKQPEESWKNLSTKAALINKTKTLLGQGYYLKAETDMRAMRNPTRLNAIQQATRRLVELMRSSCPVCEAPGYAKIEAIEGLPCQLCGTPTRSAKAYVYQCPSCKHSAELAREDKAQEDPMYCDVCNP